MPFVASPLSLYIHTPWCVRKCPYCDFNSHTLKGGLPQRGHIDTLLRDLEQHLPLAQKRPLHSIFFGCGTPSPIVREQDIARFNRYRTRELILGYMNALAAGDCETVLNL